ncbi:hypothetical protein GE061_001309 [Apolygus lucorum]|uniref:Uncharacterized protein n=1 Tax=Apolygus lucorum TaxID=248454 RepID=A0A8S9Y9L2_APOLU|nr:hypothetical protein GE061_001309 [Apolygus lucorum]
MDEDFTRFPRRQDENDDDVRRTNAEIFDTDGIFFTQIVEWCLDVGKRRRFSTRRVLWEVEKNQRRTGVEAHPEAMRGSCRPRATPRDPEGKQKRVAITRRDGGGGDPGEGSLTTAASSSSGGGIFAGWQ